MIVSVSAPAFADGETTEKGYMVYTKEEYDALNLETPLKYYWSTTPLNNQVSVDNRLDTTPTKYLFKTADTTDSKEYIILKSVNAGADDGYFVLVNGYTDTVVQTPYNTVADKTYFDVKDENSIAYKMNADNYMTNYFPLMKNYINVHTWYTEPIDDNFTTVYSTDAKIALLSLSEYAKNADRIGVKNGKDQWLLRTRRKNSVLWFFITSQKSVDGNAKPDYAGWSGRSNRPCFYLSKDFFKNVKLDMTLLKTPDSEAAKIIKEIASEENGIATLTKAGYTESDLTELGIATGSVKITSATIAGNGKCGSTLTAKVTTEGTATKTSYSFYGVKADGTSTLLETNETGTYTVKFADLDYAKINCLAEVYSGETLSHSAYTNEITLETKPTFASAPAGGKWTGARENAGTANTNGEYNFTVNGKEFTLLKSVNAGANDGQFVMSATGLRGGDETTSWYTDYGQDVEAFIYDPADTRSLAYKVNTADKVNEVIPSQMADYINSHRWWNEGIKSFSGETVYYQKDAFAADSKLALLSYTEYAENIERIDYTKLNNNALLRSPEYDWNGSKNGNPRILYMYKGSSGLGILDAAGYTTEANIAANKKYGYWQAKTIGFYLNPDFFAEQKVDFDIDKNTEVVKILRKKLESKTVDELRTIGYSLIEIKELFPEKVANLGKIAMIDFSKNGNNVKFTCVNLSDSEITFKPVAAAYESNAMICSDIGEEITLAKGESKDVNVTLDVGTSSPDTLKAFAWNVETLTPFAPCKTVNYTALAPET